MKIFSGSVLLGDKNELHDWTFRVEAPSTSEKVDIDSGKVDIGTEKVDIHMPDEVKDFRLFMLLAP